MGTAAPGSTLRRGRFKLLKPKTNQMPQLKKFTKDDLRYWEFCKVHGYPLPSIPAKKLIALWKKHGFDARVLPVLKTEYALYSEDGFGRQNVSNN
jgi:hypothetical protein